LYICVVPDAARTEFTRDEQYALVSIWEMDGAPFKEVKRLPMKKPSGKCNIYNQITRAAGTNH
jgi:hypothetical protein